MGCTRSMGTTAGSSGEYGGQAWTWSRVLDLVPGPGPGPGSWTWSRVLDLVPGPSCVMQMLKRPVGGTSLPRVGAVGVSHCDW